MSCINRVDSAACTGCGACANVCPAACIRMCPDQEGFLRPAVDESSCVDCGKCLRICPSVQALSIEAPKVWLGAVSRGKGREKSSSGGVFFTLAGQIIRQGGVVCGAAMCSDHIVRHICVEDQADLHLLQGSKYVQSSTVGCYRKIIEFLNLGRTVLFSGTPCQVAGLYACAGKNERLLTVDLVCHGVPSPMYFKDYLAKLEAKHGKRAEEVSFRDKNSRNRTSFRLKLAENGICWYDRFGKQDLYYSLFLDGLNYRHSCYQCPYATRERVGDITLGDLGSYRAYPDFYPDEATSFVGLNTDRGIELWDTCRNLFDTIQINPEKEISCNHQLSRPVEEPEIRGRIYTLVHQLPARKIMRRYCKGLSSRERIALLIKNMLPVEIVRWIRNRF